MKTALRWSTATQARFTLIWGLLFMGAWMLAFNIGDLQHRPLDGALVMLFCMLLPGVATTWILWHAMQWLKRSKR